MSSWTFIIADAPARNNFIYKARKVLNPFGNSVTELSTKGDSDNPVRLSVGSRLYGTDKSEEALKKKYGSDRTEDFLHRKIRDGEFIPNQWIVVLSGNDTASAASAKVYESDTFVDEFSGNERRLGHDVAAYLERYHGILVDPLPEKMGWRDRGYSPEYDLRKAYPSKRTLSEPEISRPFEYDNRPTWLRLIIRTADEDALEAEIRKNVTDLFERQPTTTDSDGVVRFEFEYNMYEHGFVYQALRREIFRGHLDIDFAILVVGTADMARTEVRVGDDVIDSIAGDPGYFGADIEQYLEQYHGISVDATLDSPPETPDNVKDARSRKDDWTPLSEHVDL